MAATAAADRTVDNIFPHSSANCTDDVQAYEVILEQCILPGWARVQKAGR